MDLRAELIAHRAESEMPPGRPHFWPLIILMLLLMAFAVSFLGPKPTPDVSPAVSPAGTPDREARIYSVSYRFGVFSPTNLRIHVGDTVRWRNDSPLPIRVMAQLQAGQKVPEFDSIGMVQPGSLFSMMFANVGTYGYYNPSDSNESGVIIVR